MVKVTQVRDSDDEWELSDSEVHDVHSHTESIIDRIIALKYIIPAGFRGYVFTFWTAITRRITKFSIFIGNSMWILTTSVFLVGFPLFYEYQREEQLKFMEKQERMFPGSSDHSGSVASSPASNIFGAPSPSG